ncbi:MAG: ATP-binding cassette domain-containing protein [Vulcanibacillus sp.]
MNNYLDFKNISKIYSNVKALDDVSFSIKKGRCTGLLGINGAGKTTTLKILSGLISPSTGEVLFNGNKINLSSPSYKGNIGFLSQSPKFHGWMTGYEFLSYIGDLYRMSSDEKKSRINEVLDIVNLNSAQNKKVHGYSGGMKQRLGIAQAILHQPPFLILDEPVSALDPEGRYQIINLLKKLKNHTTILFSTHILHDADSICDDVIILHDGKKIIKTELNQLKENYLEPIIKISLVNASDNILSVLKGFDWIEGIEVNNRLLSLRIKNQDIALKKLPIILLENNSPFTSFEIYEPQLEDIFLKLVNKK